MIEVRDVNGYKFISKDGLTQSVVPAYPGGYLVVNVPNLSQCEEQFQAAKRSPVQNIYFYNKNTLVI